MSPSYLSSCSLPSALLLLFIAGTVTSGGMPDSCPANSPLSCHASAATQPSCCFNSPGGQLLQTQFWDTDPPTGPADSWTVHGLWPDKCDGTFDQFCDPSREYTNITAILQQAGQDDLLAYMNTYWKDYQGNDESFWEHEWNKHGTCINTLDPQCFDDYAPQDEVVAFFSRTVDLFKTLDSYKFLSDAGITPSTTTKYTSSAILAALKAPRGVDVTIQCNNNALDEIWYFFNVRGSVATGTYVPSNPDGSKSSCPASGVSYLPKAGSPPPPGGGGGGTALSGKGFLNVAPASSGQNKGCLISNGKWLVGGTCATYTATPSSSSGGFTLTSSKGPCAVVGGTFSCASGNQATTFGAAGGKLAVAPEGSTSFYAAQVPSGTTQVNVQTGTASVAVGISWQGTG